MIKLVVYLNFFRLWPHLIFLAINKHNSALLEDLTVYRNQYSISGSNAYLLLHLLRFHKSFRTLFYFRIGMASHLISWLAPGINNLRIPPKAKIGGGLLFFHAFGTILAVDELGDHCRILQNVTLGEKNGKNPTIGNRVTINPGATIIGDITIGDNCVIGPNAVVFKSVPANCVVVGNPAIILKRDGVLVREPL